MSRTPGGAENHGIAVIEQLPAVTHGIAAAIRRSHAFHYVALSPYRMRGLVFSQERR